MEMALCLCGRTWVSDVEVLLRVWRSFFGLLGRHVCGHRFSQKLWQEFSRVMGKAPPRKLDDVKATTFCGHTIQSLRARAKKRVSRDARSFKTKALEVASLFRERQLQMQEKQKEMLTRMQGPDWPKEDWPLTNSDAKHVGDAENIIHSGLDELGRRLAPAGGIAQVHETQDEYALEILMALGDMMSCYTRLIDRHAEKVKRSQKKAGKKEEAPEDSPSSPSSPSPPPSSPGSPGAGGLNEVLKPFSSPGDRLGLGGSFGSLLGRSSLGDLALVGSSLGGLRPEPDLNAWGGLSAPAPADRKPENSDNRWTAAQPVYNDVEL